VLESSATATPRGYCRTQRITCQQGFDKLN
jgi:hypothetical protein